MRYIKYLMYNETINVMGKGKAPGYMRGSKEASSVLALNMLDSAL